MSDAPSVDLDALVNLEQTFYDAGYADGHAHGRIHGLIEGRALGREKGFEMWEELGFYEGFAKTWAAVLQQGTLRTRSAKEDERAANHIRHLLELIAQFPVVNPSSAPPPSSSATSVAADSASGTPDAELDIPKLFRQIRSRYKVLCATLGVRPSLRAADGDGEVSPPAAVEEQMDVAADSGAAQQEIGVGVRLAGRTPRKAGVWPVEGAKAQPPGGLSF